jgi:hypothetical protein
MRSPIARASSGAVTGSCAAGLTSTGEPSARGATIDTTVGSGIAPASTVAVVSKPAQWTGAEASRPSGPPSSLRTSSRSASLP